MRFINQSLKMISITFILAMIVFAAGCNQNLPQKNRVFILRPGDLLFQDLDCGPFCDAIEKVTTGYKGANLSHVGIVTGDNHGNVVIIEALLTGVEVTPLDTFLDRSHDTNGQPKVLAGRLIPKYHYLIPFVLREALVLKGKPYDKLFDTNNDAYYCSELVYYCFLKANDDKPIFELQPMTFVDPETGRTFPAWKEYFEQLKVPIPQGNPGINPGSISRSHILTIVHAYGAPSGWEKGERNKSINDNEHICRTRRYLTEKARAFFAFTSFCVKLRICQVPLGFSGR